MLELCKRAGVERDGEGFDKGGDRVYSHMVVLCGGNPCAVEGYAQSTL